eukprot:351893-Chlamydomonas_euryale.AAC.19
MLYSRLRCPCQLQTRNQLMYATSPLHVGAHGQRAAQPVHERTRTPGVPQSSRQRHAGDIAHKTGPRGA